MSINGSLQIGRSALAASQTALQVAGNNMANAATPGYHRRTVHLTPMTGEAAGRNQFVGLGVELQSIQRQVDTAIQGRLRSAISDEHASLIDQRFLTSIETLQNELTDNDVSSLLSEFFNAFSEVANNPEDSAVRSVAIEQGVALAERLTQIRSDYQNVRLEVDRALGSAVERANELLDQIASLNREIGITEGGGGGTANALRDQRDLLIDTLSEIVDISVVHQDNGGIDVFIGSIPVVLAGTSRGIALEQTSDGDQPIVNVRVRADGSFLDVQSGEIGGLIRQREETVLPVIDQINDFASQLIFQVNRIHSQGQGSSGFTSVNGATSVDDAAANLNSSAANLPFRIENGSFILHVTNTQSGLRESYQIDVDGDADSLEDVIDRINVGIGVANLTASIGADDNFELESNAGYEISFSDDSSGALAVLGVNTFFTGRNATDIEVNDVVLSDPDNLAVGANHIGGTNDTAIAIANLQDQSITELGNKSLRQYWQAGVNNLASRTRAAGEQLAASQLVRESLFTQEQAVSGVSLDEEAINMLQYQRQFQAAARFITTIDELLQTLLSIA